LAKLGKWTGTELCHQITCMVPAIVLAHNEYVNSVNRMEQQRSANPARRNERRLHMTLFTLFLDLAVNNAYALFVSTDPAEATTVKPCQFKKEVCEKLIKSI
jgi:hypothetical protein